VRVSKAEVKIMLIIFLYIERIVSDEYAIPEQPFNEEFLSSKFSNVYGGAFIEKSQILAGKVDFLS
jgi:hypothetical protein